MKPTLIAERCLYELLRFRTAANLGFKYGINEESNGT